MGKVVATGVLCWHRVVFLRVFDVLIKTLIFAGGGRALLLRFCFTWALTPPSLCVLRPGSVLSLVQLLTLFAPFLDEMVPGGQGWDRGPEQVSCASCFLEGHARSLEG